MKQEFALIHEETKKIRIVNINELKLALTPNYMSNNPKNWEGFKWPNNVYEFLNNEQKEAWNLGWRGYLQYFY